MLNDFRDQFAGKRKLTGGLQQAHDALHRGVPHTGNARGFREAIAWTLVLPPSAPLPARLTRYEQKVAGFYSLRQQIVMVDKALDHDPTLIELVTKDSPPLPLPGGRLATTHARRGPRTSRRCRRR